jgi:RNA polymerase sigma-70 factor (ECF subfamily)
MSQSDQSILMKGQESSEEFSDLQLVAKCLDGEIEAFSLLVERHQRGLMRVTLRLIKDPDMAEDIVQEAFIKAYEKLSGFEGKSSFKSWLYMICVNTAKNKLRGKHQTQSVDDFSISKKAIAENNLVFTSISAVLQEKIDSLPVRQRTALVLRIYEDLSFKEIAEIMECPYDTAKANFRHAIQKLKLEFSGDESMLAFFDESADETRIAFEAKEIEA